MRCRNGLSDAEVRIVEPEEGKRKEKELKEGRLKVFSNWTC